MESGWGPGTVLGPRDTKVGKAVLFLKELRVWLRDEERNKAPIDFSWTELGAIQKAEE